ncbi:serine protease, partial [Planctomycetota bacterium]|nr:serine protease [Planctomycetota bacterium]
MRLHSAKVRATQRACVLLALALGAASPALAQDPDEAPVRHATHELLERVFPSVVKVYGAGGFVGIPGYGTGTIVDERGFVLTAWSIALRDDALKVVTDEGVRYEAELWLADPGQGVALLKIKSPATSFPALRPDANPDLSVGGEVLAIGNTFGFIYGRERPGVQRGVVSAITDLHRPGSADERLPQALDRVLVTDVPNNPGTQGGPLVTLDGRFVGVLGRLVESRTTNTIINYAVPCAEISEWLREGLNRRSARGDIPPLPRPPGDKPPVETGLRLQRAHLVRSPMAYVERVADGSPAAAAGVEADDLVFRVSGLVV